jgi:hypothetical protein
MNDAAEQQEELDDGMQEQGQEQEVAPEAPQEEQAPAKIEFTPEQQAFINEKIVGEKVAKQREAERRAEELQKELEETRSRIPEPERPSVPPAPDPFDDDYEEKIRARDESIRAAAEYDAAQQERQRLQQFQQQQAQEERRQKGMKMLMTYSERADKLGIAADKLQVAGNRVAQYGIQNEVAQYILDDEQGPNITMYLAENPLVLDEIRHMDPIRAGIYIESNVKSKAMERLNSTPPPAPTEAPDGQGFPEGDRGPKGASYE